MGLGIGGDLGMSLRGIAGLEIGIIRGIIWFWRMGLGFRFVLDVH